jgi:Na+/proline symporter
MSRPPPLPRPPPPPLPTSPPNVGMTLTASDVPSGPEILDALPSGLITALAIVLIAVGLAVCFLGTRVLRLALFVIGFGAGAVVAGVITWKETHDNDKTLIATALAGLLVGVVACSLVLVGEVRAGRAGPPHSRVCVNTVDPWWPKLGHPASQA